MKTISILRHAKSSWKIKSLDDIYRPLNKRGYKDSVNFGKTAKEFDVLPKNTAIVCSPSVRTYTTASIVSDTIYGKQKNILIDEKLYTFDMSHKNLLEYLTETYKEYDSILIVGHNETLRMLVSHLSQGKIDTFPTCAFVQFSIDPTIILKSFYTPKKGFIDPSIIL